LTVILLDYHAAWNDPTRRQRLHSLAKSMRFLILSWVRVPHLASHGLSQGAHRIGADWNVKCGHGLEWLETFRGE
jgi:hypothetical protein